MKKAYFEISPLFENQWTGISNVTAELARSAMADAALGWEFLYQNIHVERSIVRELLGMRKGGSYLSYLEKRLWEGATLKADDARGAACIFPNVKTLRRFFGREALIVHDLSTLLTPEFHTRDTILYHANRLRGDVETSDFIFCVSQATRNDVLAYLGAPPENSAVLPLGINLDPCALCESIARRDEFECEAYICVLGTIEPRKNGKLVLELIRQQPILLDRYRIVFIGREGWMDEKAALLSQLNQSGIDTDRIVFSGFVSEDVKLRLLLNCKFCIYPSFFEGYGMPVAEAALVGKYVVCSNTSSLTEVAPDMCFFFDPLDLSSLIEAVERAEQASRLTRFHRLSFHDLSSRLRARSWHAAYTMIKKWTEETT